MRPPIYMNFLLHYSIYIVFLAILVTQLSFMNHSFAHSETCMSTQEHTQTTEISTECSQKCTQEPLTLTLQDHGIVHEEIILHVTIPDSMMPANAWGRVAIKSNVTLEDGTIQEGRIEVLEGVPETSMRFPQKGMYELTISVGYLVKST